MTTKAKESLRHKLLSATVKGKPYEIPEIGLTIELRSMTVGQMEALGELGEDDDAVLPTLIATCFDPKTGEALFTEDDSEWVRSQPISVIEPLMSAALEASGVDPRAAQQAIESGKDGS